MRANRFVPILWCSASLLAGVNVHSQTAAHLSASSRGLLIVPVSINGSGPYPFLLDTGSNRTLVSNDLLRTLGIEAGTQVAANTPAGTSYVRQVVVPSLAVAGLTLHEVEIEGADAASMRNPGDSVEGILGEDFLKHFDVLIDNQAKMLSLDDTSGLSASLAGEHVPLSFSGVRDGHPTRDRLVVDLKLSDFGEPRRFLIDSGAGEPLYFPAKLLPFERRARVSATLHTVGGNTRCRAEDAPLVIGHEVFPDVDLALCEGIRSNADVDGVVPAKLFKRLFISHRGAYVILNPRSRERHL